MAERARWRLAVMMALVYAVQGAWWPLLAVHLRDLGISGRGRGAIFATFALASLATPLVAGAIADGRVPAQRLLAAIYALGAVLLVALATGLGSSAVAPLFAMLLIYWLVTAPGQGLCNALAFRNLDRPEAQFGGVRLWGTVGWMAVGWVVAGVMAANGSTRAGQGAYEAFWVGAVLSGLLSVYSLTLPHTPPLAFGPRSRGVAWGEARELLRRPGVAIFLVAAFGASLGTPFVYQTVPPYLSALGLPHARVALAMSLGQILEVASLVALPRILGGLGQRRTLALGLGAWVGYYTILAARPPLGVALMALPLNGVAIALFHIAGPMFLDSQAAPHRRASVQGLYLLVASGLGTLLGNLLAGELVARAGGVGANVFLFPCLINAGVLALFLLFFPRLPRPASQAFGDPFPHSPRPAGLSKTVSH
jgi:MFS family permease